MDTQMDTQTETVAPVEAAAPPRNIRGLTESAGLEARWQPIAADGGNGANIRGVRRRSSNRSQSSSQSRSQSGALDGEGGDDHPVLWESGDSLTDSASEAGDEVIEGIIYQCIACTTLEYHLFFVGVLRAASHS